jgi:hypothetical protein
MDRELFWVVRVCHGLDVGKRSEVEAVVYVRRDDGRSTWEVWADGRINLTDSLDVMEMCSTTVRYVLMRLGMDIIFLLCMRNLVI